MYKDKEKQKEANKEANKRYRDKQKGITPDGVSREGITDNDKCDVPGEFHTVPGSEAIPNFGLADCECKHCQNNRKNGSRKVINHGPYKTIGELADNELNRVTFPSDPDYRKLEALYQQSLISGPVIAWKERRA